MGGKPNRGTPKDKRLKRNRTTKKRKSKNQASPQPFASTRTADGRFPI